MGRHHSTNIHQRRTSAKRHRRRGAALLGIVVVLATACGSDNDSDDTAAIAGEDAPAASIPAEAMDERSGNLEAEATGGAPSNAIPINDFGRDIIRNVALTMLTGDVNATVNDVRRISGANGGAVFSSDVTIGDRLDDGSVPGGGHIVVRVPPADLSQLIADLDGAGFVSRLTQDSQDVTDQLVDLEIRIRQAETGIERIEQLLAQATELGDVFAIETELTTRQVELEQLRAAERNTSDLVALATLTINIEYQAPAALAEAEPDDGIGDAFVDGWNAFVGAVFAIGYVLAISAPFLLTLLVVIALAMFIGRRWARRNAHVREQQRIAADRRGPITSDGVQSPSSPPPPVASQRITSEGTQESVDGTDTLIADDDDTNPEE